MIGYNMNLPQFGTHLKSIRKTMPGRNGIDFMAMATGLSKTTILDIETGRKHYTTASLLKYLDYINYDVSLTPR
jgi:transcriptional regulator with XRE-family HTH domain